LIGWLVGFDSIRLTVLHPAGLFDWLDRTPRYKLRSPIALADTSTINDTANKRQQVAMEWHGLTQPKQNVACRYSLLSREVNVVGTLEFTTLPDNAAAFIALLNNADASIVILDALRAKVINDWENFAKDLAVAGVVIILVSSEGV
jgi:hypothetical protein